MGKEIRTLIDEVMIPGKHEVIFDAADLASGVYFYQLNSNGKVETKKMIVD
jgi:hypothetical protein